MRAVVCLNGEPPDPALRKLLDGAFVVACDGAFDWLGGRADLLVGDFDSVEGEIPPETEVLRFSAHKDFTDGELATDTALSRGFDEIDFLGGGGRRDDHFYFNLYLLLKVLRAGGRGRFLTNYTEIRLFDESFTLKVEPGTLISLAPYFESVHIIKTYGLEYGLTERTLLAGESLGVSNVACENEVTVELKDGLALVFVSRPETDSKG